MLTAQRSVVNNRRYLELCLTPYAFGHNLKMLIAHARFSGQLEAALEAARATSEPAAGEEATPAGGRACVDCAGVGSPEEVLTLLRFGRWEALLEVAQPSSWGDERWVGYNQAAFWLARASAFYAIGRVSDADAARDRAVASASELWASVVPAELRAMRAWRVEHDHAAALNALREGLSLIPVEVSYPCTLLLL